MINRAFYTTKGDMCIVTQQQRRPSTYNKLWAVKTRGWVGQQYMVTDPNNAHIKKAHHSYHIAYLETQAHDKVTCLSPPNWVYSDETRFPGEWCMLGTHYTTNTTVEIPIQRCSTLVSSRAAQSCPPMTSERTQKGQHGARPSDKRHAVDIHYTKA